MKKLKESKFIMSLSGIPKFFYGLLRYRLKEILMILIILILGTWLLTSNISCGSFKTKSNINVNINKQAQA